MSDTVANTARKAKKLAVYEQAACCITGICGAKANSELLRMSSVYETLKAKGISLEVYNLSRTPRAFAENKQVLAYLRANGEKALPVCTLDGEIAVERRYPTNEEIIEALALEQNALDELLPPGKLLCER